MSPNFPAELNILFEDDHILLVNKPGGLATQAPRQFDSLEARVRTYLSRAADSTWVPYLGIPHRLDRCASGVIVFAKRVKAAQRLSKQFQRREVTKTYLALIHTAPAEASGTWTDHLRKVPDEPRTEVVTSVYPGAKHAVLHYSAEPLHEARWRMRIQLETGRMHQIRVQLASRGHPILGDAFYGSTQPFGPPASHPRDQWIALHAAELGFRHPRSRDSVEFSAPTPACWLGVESTPMNQEGDRG